MDAHQQDGRSDVEHLGTDSMLTFPGLEFTRGIRNMRDESSRRLTAAAQRQELSSPPQGPRGADMTMDTDAQGAGTFDNADETRDGTGDASASPEQGPGDTLAQNHAAGQLPGQPAGQGDAQDDRDGHGGIPAAIAAALHEIAPNPDVFNGYDEETRRTLLKFIDREIRAQFDDESRRQDMLVQAEIRQSQRGQLLSVFLVLAAIAAATAVGLVVRDAAMVGAFLALPFAAIIGNLFRPIISRSDRGGS